MKKIFLLLKALVFSLSAFAQTEHVKGSLATADTADLTILNIYPDSFPNVSVIFKAETRKGEPVWNLTEEKMIVKENGQNCEVVSLEQVSKNKAINLGIVIDHSESMLFDFAQFFDSTGKFLFENIPENVIREKYTAPIENAKSAVKTFVSLFNAQKDYICIIGFSKTVDIELPLTNDTSRINVAVDSMHADFSTALYDAMIAGIDRIKNAEGIKVLVALTDGQDNMSKARWNDVVDKANKEEIPIYIIGLGDANIDTLTLIANSTKGQLYYTRSSNSLNTIYAIISKNVQAFYDIIYRSPNFSSADSTRQIELSFETDSLFLIKNPSVKNLPDKVIAYLAKKEREKQYLLYGGITVVVIITSLVLMFYRKKGTQARTKSTPVINKIFPNPGSGNINLEYVSRAGDLKIFNLYGRVVKIIPITGMETQFDLTDLMAGNYFAVIHSGGEQSNTVSFVIQH